MDIPHFCKLLYFQIVFLLLMARGAYGRIYSVKPKQQRTSDIGRHNDPSGPEVYISDLWKSALNRQTPTQESKSNNGVMLTPSNGPGTGISHLLSQQDQLHALSLLSSGNDDDGFDFSNSHGKIINFHDQQKGPMSVLKSPGSVSSVVVTQRGGNSFRRKGNESLQKKIQSVIKSLALKKQAKARTSGDMNQNNGYIGPLTTILADALCPLCRRLSNSRLRVSCLLRYCLENPNLTNGNPR